MHDYHVVGIARKILTCILDSIICVVCLCNRGLQIQLTVIIGIVVVRCCDYEVAHWLETCGARADHSIIHYGFRRLVITTEKSTSGIIQIVGCPLLVVVTRSSRPNCALIQTDIVLCDTAVNDSAHITIADRESVGE